MKLTEIQQNVEHLLSQLQASEHDKIAAHLTGPTGIRIGLRTRRKVRQANRALPHLDLSSSEVRQAVESYAVRLDSEIAPGSMGFKGDFRQWQEFLRIGD